MTRFLLLTLCVFALGKSPGQTYSWQNLSAAPTSGGKQDDLYFLNPDTGFCVNGLGRIFRTVNRGQSFTRIFQNTGTYFRAIVALDARRIFAGNIGPGYFPNVTDTTLLYQSLDGGNQWTPVAYSGPRMTGICAFSLVRTPFINAGILDTQTTLIAGGRVGGPAFLLRSDDAGQTWTSRSLATHISMITDVHFFTPDSGFVFGGTHPNIALSRAKIIFTPDGGQTWTTVYQSARAYETIWKGHFPSRQVGYATVLSYSTGSNSRFVCKTTDGGFAWSELPVTQNGAQLFGVGFVNDSIGWVGSNGSGFRTLDGGQTWTSGGLTQACNKIRFVRRGTELAGYGIGVGISRLRIVPVTALELPGEETSEFRVFPNPSGGSGPVFCFPADFGPVAGLSLVTALGQQRPAAFAMGENGRIELTGPSLAPGQYLARFRFVDGQVRSLRFMVQGGQP